MGSTCARFRRRNDLGHIVGAEPNTVKVRCVINVSINPISLSNFAVSKDEVRRVSTVDVDVPKLVPHRGIRWLDANKVTTVIGDGGQHPVDFPALADGRTWFRCVGRWRVRRRLRSGDAVVATLRADDELIFGTIGWQFHIVAVELEGDRDFLYQDVRSDVGQYRGVLISVKGIASIGINLVRVIDCVATFGWDVSPEDQRDCRIEVGCKSDRQHRAPHHVIDLCGVRRRVTSGIGEVVDPLVQINHPLWGFVDLELQTDAIRRIDAAQRRLGGVSKSPAEAVKEKESGQCIAD